MSDVNDFTAAVIIALRKKHEELEKLSESPEANDGLVFDIEEFLEGLLGLIKKLQEEFVENLSLAKEQEDGTFINAGKETFKKQEKETIEIFLLSLYCFGPDDKKCFSTDEITKMLEKHKEVVCTILKEPSYEALCSYRNIRVTLMEHRFFGQNNAEVMGDKGSKVQSGAAAATFSDKPGDIRSNTAKR